MFIVLLKFSSNKDSASQFMDAHRQWVKHGFEGGVFLLVGSLEPDLGGAILAHNTSLSDLRNRLSNDPFVAEKIVSADILEISPSRTDARLAFLITE